MLLSRYQLSQDKRILLVKAADVTEAPWTVFFSAIILQKKHFTILFTVNIKVLIFKLINFWYAQDSIKIKQPLNLRRFSTTGEKTSLSKL